MIIFLKHVLNTTVFIITFLVATLLPNIDQIASRKGGGNAFVDRPLKIFAKSKGFFHSFTFCLIVTILFVWYVPVLAFPFFLGYSLHLIEDAWTTDGIKPFWPLNKVSKGKVQTGGSLEETVFFIFIVLDLVFLFLYLI